MTSSNGNIFRVTVPLCGEFTGHRWIPVSDVELWCFLWSVPEKRDWASNRDAIDLRPYRAHYDVTVIQAFRLAGWLRHRNVQAMSLLCFLASIKFTWAAFNSGKICWNKYWYNQNILFPFATMFPTHNVFCIWLKSKWMNKSIGILNFAFITHRLHTKP